MDSSRSRNVMASRKACTVGHAHSFVLGGKIVRFLSRWVISEHVKSISHDLGISAR